MNRVAIKPELLRWARERSGIETDELERKFPRLQEWEGGEVNPTMRQVELYAKATRTPVGYLFLNEPPEEQIPVPDFRTVRSEAVGRPSPDLLEMIHICQQRQTWYREYARSLHEDALAFVGSVQVGSDVTEAAAAMRRHLDLSETRSLAGTWTDALRACISRAEDAGILVMCSGVVLNNTHRPLDPEEFRGFALTDEYAPLVFINGKDTKAAQMFTLAHELAHIWSGQSGISDIVATDRPDDEVERWCNEVAAEFLVPLDALSQIYDPGNELTAEMQRLARHFKVSSLVILRRIHDIGGIAQEEFWLSYDEEVGRIRDLPRGSGGNFYLTQPARASRRFTSALVGSTLEGYTSFTEAFRLLGLKKTETFRDLGRSLGVTA